MDFKEQIKTLVPQLGILQTKTGEEYYTIRTDALNSFLKKFKTDLLDEVERRMVNLKCLECGVENDIKEILNDLK